MVNRLGTNDNIAVARTVSTDMQTRCAFFPTAIVPFDLHRTECPESDTYGIDDVDIFTIVNDINRGIQTTLDESSEIILVQPVSDHMWFILIQHCFS